MQSFALMYRAFTRLWSVPTPLLLIFSGAVVVVMFVVSFFSKQSVIPLFAQSTLHTAPYRASENPSPDTSLASNISSSISSKRNRELEQWQYRHQLQEAELRRQGVLRNALLGGVFLLLVIVMILANRNLLKKRITASLVEKNQALSYANNEIVRQQRILEDQAAEIELANSELHEYNLQLRTLNFEVEQRIAELETIDSIVHAINLTMNFSDLLKNLINQGKKLLPAAEKGSVLVLNHTTNLYEFQAFFGLNPADFQGIALTYDEIERRYLHYDTVGEGVHVITQFPKTTSEGEKFSNVQAPECALFVTIPVGDTIEGMVFFDVYTSGYRFSASDIARIKRFRQHIITAFAQARALDSIRKAAAQLSEQNTALQELNHEKTEFLGIAAHDLKNPLAQIMMSAGKIHKYFDRMSKEDILRSMEQIERTSRRMSDIITNLLDVNAIESHLEDEMHLTERTVHALRIDDLVRSIADDLRPQASAKHIEIDFHAPREAVCMTADELSMRSIIENLCSNAVKYSPHGTTISLALSQTQDRISFSVQDEGPGISTAEQERLFTKFARLSAKPTGGEHSTGLGLSIVKKLVTGMQGKVWCESEAGHGATFFVELPKSECGVPAE